MEWMRNGLRAVRESSRNSMQRTNNFLTGNMTSGAKSPKAFGGISANPSMRMAGGVGFKNAVSEAISHGVNQYVAPALTGLIETHLGGAVRSQRKNAARTEHLNKGGTLVQPQSHSM